ncbi:hypothetical protein ABIA33_000041 [Streptacidiphilus sp. MAP12-16]
MGHARFLIVTRPARTDTFEEVRMAWRLLSANNRELGRSLTDFLDEDSCREAVAWLRDNVERAASVMCTVQPSAMWGWRLDIDERPVALSARAYRRQRECRYNLAQFRAGVLDADPAAPRARNELTA